MSDVNERIVEGPAFFQNDSWFYFSGNFPHAYELSRSRQQLLKNKYPALDLTSRFYDHTLTLCGRMGRRFQ